MSKCGQGHTFKSAASLSVFLKDKRHKIKVRCSLDTCAKETKTKRGSELCGWLIESPMATVKIQHLSPQLEQ